MTYYDFARSFTLVSMCICAGTLYFTLYRDSKFQQRHLIYSLFSCMIADLGTLGVIYGGDNLRQVAFSYGIIYMGTAFFFLSMITMVAYVTRIDAPAWFTLTMFVIDAVIILLYHYDDVFKIFHINYQLQQWHGTSYYTFDYGIAGIIFFITSMLVPTIGCVGLLVYAFVKDRNIARRKEYAQVITILVLMMILTVIYTKSEFFGIYNVNFVVTTIIICIMVVLAWKDQGVDEQAEAAFTAVNTIETGVISINKYNELLYYNSVMAQIYPDIERILGSNIGDKYMPEINDLKPGRTEQITINDHKYHIRLTEDLDQEYNVKGYIVTYTDMTDMYDMMEHIQEAQRKADEANQTKSQFLANITHEIRTPMNAIVGMSDLIIEESRGRKVYDMAVTIKKASMSLLGLVNNILDYSKFDAGKIEIIKSEYYLHEMTEDICKMLRVVAANRGLQIKYDIDKSLPCKLLGDEQKIRQVIINIMNNGIKFTNDGYVRLSVSGIRNGNDIDLTFMISDTGIGIKEENLGRIFGEFEQVDKIKNKSVEGSGLGLAISKRFIELMDGNITVDSVYGEGTTFTIRITQTIIDEMPIEMALNTDITEEQSLKMFKVNDLNMLIVDDNKVNLLVAHSVVEPYGFNIDEASLGRDAIELVSKKHYDIILMDHMMPEMDGIETTRNILKMYEGKEVQPKIVALTANVAGGARDMFLSKGFVDFIAKPIQKQEMHNLLLRLVPEEYREFTDEEFKEAEYTEDELAEIWMEGVDVRTAVEGRGAGVEGYLELLDLYYMEGQTKLEQMKEAIEAEDIKNYEILVHGLKSTSANIGAIDLSELAKSHEFAAKDGDFAFCKSGFDELVSNYEAILTEVGRIVHKKSGDKDGGNEPKLQGLTLTSLKQAVYDIVSLSESFKTKEAADMVDKLLKYELEPEVEQILSEVKVKYKMYDDDGAEDLLHQLSEDLSGR